MRFSSTFWTVSRLKAEQRVHCGPDVSLQKDSYLSSIIIIKTCLFPIDCPQHQISLLNQNINSFSLRCPRQDDKPSDARVRRVVRAEDGQEVRDEDGVPQAVPHLLLQLSRPIRVKMEKYTEKEQYNDVMTLLGRSLLILAKLIDPMPICLDSVFCERFVKTFDFHINLLCTLYHSLNHYEIISKESRWQKEKIVQGINKMYTIHVKIKDLCKHNGDISQTLELISNYKKIFNARISSITHKLELRRQPQQQHAENFESQAAEFYEGLILKIDHVNQEPEAKKSLMRVYFQLMHQLYSAQGRLEVLLEGAMRVSTQIKGRKKNISFVGQESSNQLIRWVNVVLKPNISLKHLKKLKVDDFLKAVTTVLQEKDTYNYLLMENFQSHQQEIQALMNLIIDVAKEIDKIETSGLLSLISEYKEGLMPLGSKKFISRLIDYQSEMSRFYSLHEEAKQLQKYVQSIVLEELGEKVNILIDENQDFTLLEQSDAK